VCLPCGRRRAVPRDFAHSPPFANRGRKRKFLRFITPWAWRDRPIRPAPGLLPCPALLEHRLPAVAGVAEGPAEVLSIVEGQPIAIVLSDVDLRPDDVVDSPSKRPCLGTRCRAGRAGRGRERRERFACARPRNRGVRVCAWFNSCNALITHDLVKSKQNEILLTYPGSPRV